MRPIKAAEIGTVAEGGIAGSSLARRPKRIVSCSRRRTSTLVKFHSGSPLVLLLVDLSYTSGSHGSVPVLRLILEERLHVERLLFSQHPVHRAAQLGRQDRQRLCLAVLLFFTGHKPLRFGRLAQQQADRFTKEQSRNNIRISKK